MRLVSQHHHLESSADPFRRFSRRFMLMLVIWLAIAPNGLAAPVRGISTPTTNPIVPMTPEGGVLMIPLTAQRAGDSWPRSLTLTLADGREVTGRVAWIAPENRRHDARWTDSPLGLTVRDIQPTDRTGDSASLQRDPAHGGTVRSRAGTPFLLAELPPDADGSIELLNQTLRPRWLAWGGHRPSAISRRPTAADRPAESRPRAGDDESSDMLPRTDALDRPDPDHPLEYWRWVLLADRLGRTPPPPPGKAGDESVRLTALHTAQVWQAALDRVREHSRGVADHLRDLLTRICVDDDEGVSFAAWVADPVAVNNLLNTILDEDLDGEKLLARALEWADSHERLMLWLESASDRYARVAIVNPSFRPKVARLWWDDPDEIPIAVELPAGKLTRVRIERRTDTSNVAENARGAGGSFPTDGEVEHVPEVLLIDADERRYTLMLDVPLRPVQPPGLYLPPLSPTLTLSAVQQGQPPTAPHRYTTTAQLRRLQGRWELFVQARRPMDGEGAESDDARRSDADRASLSRNALGTESIAIFIGEEGRDGAARILLMVPEHGEHDVVRGPDHRDLRIYRRSLDDHWNCRLVLPDDWLNTSAGEATHLGVIRTYAGSSAAVSSPMPVVPWRLEPGRLSFDLSRWDDVPRE